MSQRVLDVWVTLVAQMVKNLPAMQETPGLGRSPGERNGNPLQYSFLENPMDRGAWWPTVHGGHKESDKTERLTLSLSLYSCHSVTIMCACVFCRSLMSHCLQPHALYSTRLLCPWDSPGEKLEWIAILSSRGSSQPCGSDIGKRILYH